MLVCDAEFKIIIAHIMFESNMSALGLQMDQIGPCVYVNVGDTGTTTKTVIRHE